MRKKMRIILEKMMEIESYEKLNFCAIVPPFSMRNISAEKYNVTSVNLDASMRQLFFVTQTETRVVLRSLPL